MTYSMGQEEFAVNLNLRKQYIKNKIEKCPNQLQKHDYFRHYIQAVSKTALPSGYKHSKQHIFYHVREIFKMPLLFTQSFIIINQLYYNVY